MAFYDNIFPGLSNVFDGVGDFISGPDLPEAPDYTGAAEATAQGNLDLARQQTQANRVNEYNPLGSRTFEQGFDQEGYDAAMAQWNGLSDGVRNLLQTTSTISDGSFGGAPNRDDFLTDEWTATTTLTPEQQRIFETGQQSQQKSADLGLMGLGQMEDTFGSKFSIDGSAPEYGGPSYSGIGGNVPTYQGGDYDKTRSDVVDAMMSRVNTDIGRDRDTKSAQLIAQGIPKGSEAYNREMEQLDRKQTDARQQANIAATSQAAQEHGLRQSDAQAQFVNEMASRGMTESEAINLFQNQMQGSMNEFTTGMDSRRQNISEALTQRNQPLNEYNAFSTGSQVNMPQFQAYGQAPQVSGPDYTGAATAAGNYAMGDYNSQMSGRNALMGGLFNLGAGYLAGG